jgi:flagellar P-ring protein precursor FlgI
MMKVINTLSALGALVVLLFPGLFLGPLHGASRIKDVAAFEGVRDNQLFGYGLVVGLNGTGDRSQTYFSTQTLANMLERSGITIDADRMRVKNIAAVMVTATLPPFSRQGGRIDVTVSSLGDAQSLQGGVLIMTPLQAADSNVYATAQGQIVLGGYSAGGSNARSQTNHPTVGRIANGGLVEREVAVSLADRRQLNLVLNSNDFTSASHAVKAINDAWGSSIAKAIDGRTIAVAVPDGYANRLVEFMSVIENARMDVAAVAKVVLNERTGTVVLGRDVRISEVSIIHGSLALQVGTIFNVSQPNPLSPGGTAIVPEESVNVAEEKGKTATLREGASVEEVVRALNDIGAGPRDVIAILEAIKAQGALHAELEII